ncbi:MAG: tetratricopeptide repeat protein [Syntrophorhabdales bacterium]|jgi:hypothetical protein
MNTFETGIRNALKEIDSLKTPECLDTASIGSFAENTMPEEERRRAEDHLRTCLYCIKQLNDMMELLHYRNRPASLSPELTERLRNLCPTTEKKSRKDGADRSFIDRMKAAVASLVREWRYLAVSLATACVVLPISLFLLAHKDPVLTGPPVPGNSFVRVRALDGNGTVLNETQGVIVNPKGFVASNLYQLKGARTVRILLRDGRTYQTQHVWKDEDKNLAVMKIENESLPSIPMADISQITVGQSVFVVTDEAGAGRGLRESLVSDFKRLPARRRGDSLQYITLATLTSNASQGAVVDGQGKLVGLLVTGEKTINLAVPIGDAVRLVREKKAVPLSELDGVKFSAEALNLYLKGILVRDARRWQEAQDLFKKALELNPNLEGAHLELGYVYYKRHLYNLEAQEYEKALALNPENTVALFGLASNLESRGQYRQAIEKYERVLALDREDADAAYELGLAYLAQGKKDKARAIYTRLKNLDQGAAEMLRRLTRQ